MPKKNAAPKPRPAKPAVEVVNRPFFRKGTRELDVLLSQAKAKSDYALLEALDYELSFREKPQSIELAMRVRAEMARYEEVEAPPKPKTPRQSFTLEGQRAQPPLPFPEKTPEPAPDTPLRDLLDWLESVAKGMKDEEARALRESIKTRFPGFAEFAAAREGGKKK